MDFNLLTPHDLLSQIAKQAKEKRLSLNLTQQSLSDRSGVSLGVLKKFERTGKISIESLLKLALIFGFSHRVYRIIQTQAPGILSYTRCAS